MCYGWFMWYITGGIGCRFYLKGAANGYNGIYYKIGEWLVSQYGYARNQYWISKKEINYE